VKKCEQYLQFDENQAAELRRIVLFGETQSPRKFIRNYRKALQLGILGWQPMVEALMEAVFKWTPKEIHKWTKEFFDQAEYRELWHRLSMFTNLDVQLESRLTAKAEGILLPTGNDGKFCKRLKRATYPEEHARMMILLQRTQSMNIIQWRECREAAYERFGCERYKELLKQRDESTQKIRTQDTPMFTKKSCLGR
jgi:hypothetical protein